MAAVNADVSALGRIQRGRLIIRNRRQFDEQIRQMKDGAEVEIEVTRKRASRSLEQNAYYWGVVIQMLSDHTGYTPDELHDVLKMKFIPKRLAVCDGNGEVRDEFVLGGSTRKLNTVTFGEYLESIRQWAAETLDVVIPDPNQHATATSAEQHGHGWGV